MRMSHPTSVAHREVRALHDQCFKGCEHGEGRGQRAGWAATAKSPREVQPLYERAAGCELLRCFSTCTTKPKTRMRRSRAAAAWQLCYSRTVRYGSPVLLPGKLAPQAGNGPPPSMLLDRSNDCGAPHRSRAQRVTGLPLHVLRGSLRGGSHVRPRSSIPRGSCGRASRSRTKWRAAYRSAWRTVSVTQCTRAYRGPCVYEGRV
jgi:hypothetical protein